MSEPAKKTAAKKTAEAPPVDTHPSAIWERLMAPFPEDWIEKLPKVLRRDDQDKGRCQEGSRYSADGHACGGWHSRAVHLDYVGHAGITMRLNDVLGPGGWEFTPYAETPEGLPVISQSQFWAKLTIHIGGERVTKMDMAANYSGPQEALGDALRRCAMRFGIGTYLWSKSDHALNQAKAQEPEPEAQRPGDRDAGDHPEPPPEVPSHVAEVSANIAHLDDDQKAKLGRWWDNAAEQGQLPLRAHLAALTPQQAAWVNQTIQSLQEPPDPQ